MAVSDKGHDDALAAAVRFVRARLGSVAEVDVVVNLHRKGPCTVDDIARWLGLRPAHVSSVLASLALSGTVTQVEGGFEIAGGRRDAAAALAAVYDRYRHRLVEAVVDDRA